MSEEAAQTSSGVQELISRIRDKGVKSGQEEADRLVEEARERAARMLADAKAEIETLRADAEAKIEAEQTASLEALKIAARDTGLELRAAVIAAFERQVKRLVSTETLEGNFLETLVLVLAGHAADEYIKDKDIEIMVSNLVFRDEAGPEVEDRARIATLAISSEMLREGVELIPADDIEGGARVRVVDEKLEIDLTSEALSKLLLRHMLPRFRGILSGAE